MKTIYSFETDLERLRTYQSVSKNTELGLSLEYGLVGTEEWWDNIKAGPLPIHSVEGTIAELHNGPMGDWPLVRVIDDTGKTSNWEVLAELSSADIGKRLRIEFVQMNPKKPPFPGYMVHLIIRMMIAEE